MVVQEPSMLLRIPEVARTLGIARSLAYERPGTVASRPSISAKRSGSLAASSRLGSKTGRGPKRLVSIPDADGQRPPD